MRAFSHASSQPVTTDHTTQPTAVLLRLRLHGRFAVFVYRHVDHVRTAADRAILDIRLSCAGRSIDGDHDLLAARIAGIARFVNHPDDSTERGALCRDTPIPAAFIGARGNQTGTLTRLVSMRVGLYTTWLNY